MTTPERRVVEAAVERYRIGKRADKKPFNTTLWGVYAKKGRALKDAVSAYLTTKRAAKRHG